MPRKFVAIMVLVSAPFPDVAAGPDCTRQACLIDLQAVRSGKTLVANPGSLPRVYPGDIVHATVEGSDPRLLGEWECKKKKTSWVFFSKTVKKTHKRNGKLGQSVRIAITAPGTKESWSLDQSNLERVVPAKGLLQVNGSYQLQEPHGNCSEKKYFPENYRVSIKIERTHP